MKHLDLSMVDRTAEEDLIQFILGELKTHMRSIRRCPYQSKL